MHRENRFVKGLAWAALGALGVAIWLVHAVWPIESASDAADDSWVQVLHYGLAHGWRWGQDLIFTYGPLGFTTGLLYDEHTWPYLTAWYFTVHLLEVGLLVYAVSRLTNGGIRFGFLLLCLLLTPFLQRDLLHQLTLVLATCVQLTDPRRRFPVLLLILALAVILAFVKFTMFVLSGVLLVVLLIDAAAKDGWRKASIATVFAVSVGSGTWLGCGQQLSLLGQYVATSLQISSGYVEAMQVDGDPTELMFAAAAGAAFVLLLIVLACGNGSRISRTLMTATLAAAAFLLWKQGFVRHDGHCLSSFLGLPLLCCSAWVVASRGKLWNGLRWTAFAAVFAICIYAAVGRAKVERFPIDPLQLGTQAAQRLATNFDVLRHKEAWRARAEERRRQLQREWRIPELIARVGNEPVAWLMNSQGVALLNGLSLFPQGVPQSYSSYTETLANLNALPYQSATGPKFVVVRVEAMNGRLPMSNDGPALLEILSRYRPVENFGGFVLYERAAAPATEPLGEVLLDRQSRLGEEVDVASLPAGWKALSVDFAYTLRGRLIREAWKPPRTWIELTTTDGATHRLRLIPAAARAWCLLDPLVLDNQDFLKLATQTLTRRVARFKIVVDDVRTGSFAETVKVQIRKFDPGWQFDPKRREKFLYPGFSAAPVEVAAGNARVVLRRGRSVLAHGVPGYMRFAIPEGKQRVRGEFGLLPELMQLPPVPDGVLFIVSFIDKSGQETTLMRRNLNPWLNPVDAEPQQFDTLLPGSQPGTLKLTIVAGNYRVDGCFWGSVTVE